MQQELHRNELSYVEAMAISVAIMAPTAAMALNGSLAASIAGTAVPLTFLLAMVTIGLVSFVFIQFNRHFSHCGSVYAFTGVSLGPTMGFLSGWALLFTYIVFTAASSAEVGAFFQSFLGLLGLKASWFSIAILSALLIAALAYFDVRISTRVMLMFEGISLSLILVLSFVILAHGGANHHLSWVPFTLHGTRLSSIALASIFAFLSFAGFEGASSLAEETRDAKQAIPLALTSAVFLTGIFYLIVSYAQTVGFGLTKASVETFASSSAPLGDLATRYLSGGFAAAIMFGASLSAFSSALGTATTGARLLFSMGRDGFIHRRIGAVHPKHGSPYVALAIVIAVAIVQLIGLSGQSGANVFGYLGSLGVLSLLLAYLATNIGGIVYFGRKRIWRGPAYIVPALAVAALGYTLYSNVYPVPSPPYSYFPYIVIGWILIGIAIVVASPRLIRSIGKRLAEESNLSPENESAGSTGGSLQT